MKIPQAFLKYALATNDAALLGLCKEAVSLKTFFTAALNRYNRIPTRVGALNEFSKRYIPANKAFSDILQPSTNLMKPPVDINPIQARVAGNRYGVYKMFVDKMTQGSAVGAKDFDRIMDIIKRQGLPYK